MGRDQIIFFAKDLAEVQLGVGLSAPSLSRPLIPFWSEDGWTTITQTVQVYGKKISNIHS